MNKEIKVGTRVKIARTSDYFYTGEEYNPKCEGEVTEMDDSDLGILVKWDNGTRNGYNLSDLEAVEKKQHTSVKVGDRVRVLESAAGKAAAYKNQIVTVIDVPSDKYIYVTAADRLSFPLTTEKHSYGLEFELVTESFPEKWWITPKTIEEATEVAKWVDENFNALAKTWYSDKVYSHFKSHQGYANRGKGDVLYDFCPAGHTRITFEQFQKHILKQEEMKKYTLQEINKINEGDVTVVVHITSKEQHSKLKEHYPLLSDYKSECAYYLTSLNNYGYSEKRSSYDNKFYIIIEFENIIFDKVIGYKQPINLFQGKVKAGTVWKNHQDINPEYYTPNGFSSTHSLPSEIVESWEPVYEGDFKYKKGDWVVIKYTGDFCTGLDSSEWDESIEHVVQITRYRETGFTGVRGSTSTFNAYPYYNVFNNTIVFSAHENEDYILRKATEEEILNAKISTLYLGTNKVEVNISKEGIFVKGKQIDIKALEHMVNTFKGRSVIKVNSSWNVYVDVFRIGCQGENHQFTFDEIDQVIKLYYEKYQ